MEEFGKLLFIFGVVLIVLGLLFNFLPHIPKLPGDIYIDRPGIKVYIPITTSILLSVFLSVILTLFGK